VNIEINLEDKIAYDSVYKSIYKNDTLILKYNIPFYDLVQEMKKGKIIYDNYNIEGVDLRVTLHNIKVPEDVYVLKLPHKLLKYSDGDYEHRDSRYIMVELPNSDTLVNQKYKILSKCIVKYNNHFRFAFDGDTGDKSAGDEVHIKWFQSDHYPADLCVGRTVQWTNKDGDIETHKITWMRNDHRYVKFDGDIKDTSNSTYADTIDDFHRQKSNISEERLFIKG